MEVRKEIYALMVYNPFPMPDNPFYKQPKKEKTFDVVCPVGKNHIGFREKGEAGDFECSDCQFVWPVDKAGRMGKPEKSSVVRRRKEGCGCGCGR